MPIFGSLAPQLPEEDAGLDPFEAAAARVRRRAPVRPADPRSLAASSAGIEGLGEMIASAGKGMASLPQSAIEAGSELQRTGGASEFERTGEGPIDPTSIDPIAGAALMMVGVPGAIPMKPTGAALGSGFRYGTGARSAHGVPEPLDQLRIQAETAANINQPNLVVPEMIADRIARNPELARVAAQPTEAASNPFVQRSLESAAARSDQRMGDVMGRLPDKPTSDDILKSVLGSGAAIAGASGAVATAMKPSNVSAMDLTNLPEGGQIEDRRAHDPTISKRLVEALEQRRSKSIDDMLLKARSRPDRQRIFGSLAP